VWCWDKGYPCSIKLKGTNDSVFLEPNPPESDGTITFRYESSKQEKWPVNSGLLLYMMGLVSAKEIENEVYDCLIKDIVNDSNQQRITAEYNSFTVHDLIEAHGSREPVSKPLYHSVDQDLCIGQMTVSAKVPSDAEMVWRTLWNRHYEDHMDYNVSPNPNTWGWRKSGWNSGFETFKYSTKDLFIAKSKLSGISSNNRVAIAFEPESCNAPDDEPIDSVCDKTHDLLEICLKKARDAKTAQKTNIAKKHRKVIKACRQLDDVGEITECVNTQKKTFKNKNKSIMKKMRKALKKCRRENPLY